MEEEIRSEPEGDLFPPVFLSSNYSVKIKGKVLDVQLAFNHTLIFHLRSKEGGQYLVHMKFDGTILWKEELFAQCWEIKMLRQTEFIMPNKREKKIELYNLLIKQITCIPHDFEPNNKVFTFIESKLICVVEWCEQFTSVTYYSYKDLSQTKEPISTMKFQNQVQRPFVPVITVLNHQSKFSIFKQNQKQKLWVVSPNKIEVFNTVEILENAMIKLFGQKKRQQKLMIKFLWQLSPGKYILNLCKNQQRQYYLNLCESPRRYLGHLILDTNSQIHSLTVLDLTYQGSPWMLTQKDIMVREIPSSKYFLYVVTLDGQSQNVRRTHYIDFSQMQVIAVQRGLKKFRGAKSVGWNNNLCLHWNKIDDTLNLRVVDVSSSIKERSLQLLLTLNQDFDDDLLQDATSSLQ